VATEQTLPFLVGASAVEITPPPEVGILMSSVERRWAPFEGVRLPLYARAVLMESVARTDGAAWVVLVSLDLLGLSGRVVGGVKRFKSRVATATNLGLKAADLILVSTHTHSAPETLALTDLYRTAAFREWVDLLADRITRAIGRAGELIRPCRPVVGVGSAKALGIYRRIKTTQGIVLSHPSPPPEVILSREGPVDDSVHVAAFLDAADQPAAILVNAACHPVHEMCIPQVSPDYPGEMCRELERRYPHATALFLNGAAGNINPPTVSGGPANAEWHGKRLADAVDEVLKRQSNAAMAYRSDESIRHHSITPLLRRRLVRLPARTLHGLPAQKPLTAEIAALRIGDAAFVFLPGEPFVETGLAIREASPFDFTAVVGYAEDWIGYIPTDAAFDEGGYEVGPGAWSRAGRGSEEIVRREALRLLTEIDAAH